MRGRPRARRFKLALARAAYRSGLLATLKETRERRGQPATPILVYHRVVAPGDPLAGLRCHLGMAVTAASFEAQMRHLARHYRVLPLADLVAALARHETLPHSSVALTFDDGYEDNHRVAYPILKQYGLHATFFLATGFIGTPEAPWTARLERVADLRDLPSLLVTLKALPVDAAEARVAVWERQFQAPSLKAAPGSRLPAPGPDPEGREPGAGSREPGAEMMSWDQVREMHAQGYAFGGHTRRHVLLDREEPERAREEICGSYDELRAQLETEAPGFAYPNGAQNARIRDLVRDAGFRYACGMTEVLCGRDADLYDLPRRDVNMAKSTDLEGRFCPAMFEATIHGLFSYATALPHP
jgi:peptidoglycan/xylan/chitin deacetylase (PgdA/CDA1 family)